VKIQYKRYFDLDQGREGLLIEYGHMSL